MDGALPSVDRARYDRHMEERKACALLKHRFEAAGFFIEENQPFDEGGVRFDIDGYDSKLRVGYEYVTREAGDDWDVDGTVIAALEDRMKKGELYVLVIDETKAPDEKSLSKAADAFIAELEARGVVPGSAKKSTAITDKKAVAVKPPPAPKAKSKAKAPPAKTPAKKSR
ncbi:MAG: hypothetical protein JWO36_3931 [Myxococcales bacterium]|nr:hypothetical protein [Myxococcales bacterium]